MNKFLIVSVLVLALGITALVPLVTPGSFAFGEELDPNQIVVEESTTTDAIEVVAEETVVEETLITDGTQVDGTGGTEVVSEESIIVEETAGTEPVVDEVVVQESSPEESSATTAPTLTTDKEDYHPGDTATISGNFFAPLQNFILKIFGSDKYDDNYTETTQEITTDESGSFSFAYILDLIYRPFYEVVVSTLSGEKVAETWFRDAAIGTYNQCSNDDGDGYATGDQGCRWVNGNLQGNNSTYQEGEATVQRLWLDGFDVGTSHSVTFKYGTTKGGTHAYDFLTTWDHSENWITLADLCQDIDDCTGAVVPVSLFAIPQDSNANNHDNFVRNMTLRGGTITAISTPTLVGGSYAGDSETSITVTFNVDSTDDANDMCITSNKGVTSCGIALFFGAHISDSADWTPELTAVDIPGSPYHVSLDSFDGSSVGERDNQMQSSAIQVPTQATLTLLKTVINDNGGTAVDTAWILEASGSAAISGVEGNAAVTSALVDAGDYTLSETGGPAGYTASTYSCVINGGAPVVSNSLTLAPDDVATCTITNNDNAPVLNLNKVVVNDNGGTALESAWTLTATGPTSISGPGSAGSPDVTSGAGFDAGSYTLSESAGPAGYAASAWSCTNGDNDGTISIGLGETITCTITNNDNAPSLTLDKVVVNDNGGNALESAWTLTASGPTPISGPGAVGSLDVVSGPTFSAGNYTLSESAGSAGYAASNWLCSGGTQNGNQITVPLGQGVTCTITNDDQEGHLIVHKVTIPTDTTTVFSITASGGTILSPTNPTQPIIDGIGVGYTVNAGTYNVVEAPMTGWDETGNTCIDVVVANGETEECTITNTQRGHITIEKQTLPNGSVVDFTFTGDVAGTLSDGETATQEVVPGSYSSTETVPAGWDLTSIVCSDGDSSGNINTGVASFVVAPGEDVTCVFTNTQRGHIIIEKNAINDSDQIFTFNNDFGNGNDPIFTLVDDSTVGLPFYDGEVLPGEYEVSEDPVPGWQQESAVCDLGETIGSIDVAPGETVTCTFVNEELAEIILIKNTIGGDASFDFDGTGAGLPVDIDLTTIGGTASQTFSGLDQDNTYSILENVPAGWALTSSSCTGTNTPASITPNPGETVTCTFANNKPAAQIDVTPLTATNKVGDNHVITATVQVHDGDGPYVNAPDGTVVTFAITNSNGATASFVGGNTCPTVAGSCSITINSPTAGHVEVNASADPVELGVSIHVETDGIGDNSQDAEKDYVNARISIAQSATNEVDDEHTFTVTVEQSVAAGVWTPVENAVVDVNVNPVPVSFDETDCANGTNALGQCIVTVNSAIAGIFTADASTSISVNSIAFNLTTDGVGGNSDSAVKTYVNASIELTPQIGTNDVGEEHEITAHVTKNDGSGVTDASGVTVMFSLVGNAVFVGVDDDFCVTGVNGTCTVVIVDDDPGLNTINATTTFLVGGVSLTRATDGNAGPDGSDSAEKTYIAGKIIIQKVTVGGDGEFNFNADYKSDFELSNGESDDSGWIATGNHSVSEDVPTGWDLTSATCSDQSNPNTISLSDGEIVTCTFTNTKRATITIVKNAEPNDCQDFTFQRSFGANFMLDDSAEVQDCTDANQPQLMTFQNIVSGNVTVTEALPNQFWLLDSVSCVNTGDQTPYTSSLNGTTLSLNLLPGSNVTCTFNNDKVSPTRTIGFWQTHLTYLTSVFNNQLVGIMIVGNGVSNQDPLDTVGKVLGGFWSNIAKKSTGQQRNAVDKARMQLAQQLIGAKLNCAAFGCPTNIQTQIASADIVYATGTVAQIIAAAGQMGAYNESGDTIIIGNAGSADPKTAKSTADYIFWNQP